VKEVLSSVYGLQRAPREVFAGGGEILEITRRAVCYAASFIAGARRPAERRTPAYRGGLSARALPRHCGAALTLRRRLRLSRRAGLGADGQLEHGHHADSATHLRKRRRRAQADDPRDGRRQDATWARTRSPRSQCVDADGSSGSFSFRMIEGQNGRRAWARSADTVTVSTAKQAVGPARGARCCDESLVSVRGARLRRAWTDVPVSRRPGGAEHRDGRSSLFFRPPDIKALSPSEGAAGRLLVDHVVRSGRELVDVAGIRGWLPKSGP